MRHIIEKYLSELIAITIIVLLFLFGANQAYHAALIFVNAYLITRTLIILKLVISNQTSSDFLDKPIMILPYLIVVIGLFNYLDKRYSILSVVFVFIFVISGIVIGRMSKKTKSK